MFSTSDAGDINDGYEHVIRRNRAEDGTDNHYNKIFAGDTNHDYDNEIRQTRRKDGDETCSGNNYDNVVTPDYESMDDARSPSSIFPDVYEEIGNQQ